MARHGVTEFLKVFEDVGATFFDLETDLLIVLDAGGAIRRVNPAFEKILGYSESDVIGKSLALIISTRDMEQTAPLFRFLKRGGGEVLCRTVAWRYRNQQHYAIFRRVQ